MIDPVNRKARRIFDSLYRRRRLRLLGKTGMFTPSFVAFCAANAEDRW